MKIGVVQEIKDQEHRVALTPDGAHALVQAGQTVLVQEDAGSGSGFTNAAYTDAGAHVVTVDKAWDVDLVLKVKEPLESEYGYVRDQILFTYLHLAGVSPTLTTVLLAQQTTAVAYETVEDAQERCSRQYGGHHRQLLSGACATGERGPAWHGSG